MIDVSRWTRKMCERAIQAARTLAAEDRAYGRTRSVDEQDRIDAHIEAVKARLESLK